MEFTQNIEYIALGFFVCVALVGVWKAAAIVKVRMGGSAGGSTGTKVQK